MKRLLTLLLTPIFLASCIEISEDITINGTGSGRFVFELGMDDGAVKLLSFGQDSGTFFDRTALEERLAKTDNVEKYEIREAVEGKVRKTIVDLTLKDMTQNIEDFTDLASDKVKDKLDVGDQPKDPPFTVTKLENGNFKFTQNIAGQGKMDINPLLSGMFSGKNFRVKLSGKIVSANGSIAEDKGSVNWEIPMAQMLNGTSAIKALEAEIEGARPGSAVAVLTTFVVIFGVIIIGLVILRRRLLS